MAKRPTAKVRLTEKQWIEILRKASRTPAVQAAFRTATSAAVP